MIFGRCTIVRALASSILVVGLGLAGGAGLAFTAYGQAPAAPARTTLHLLPVQGNVSMLVGPGANLTIQTGKDGVLLVDTMLDEVVPAVAAEVTARSALPIRFIINTSMDPDHVGGNARLGAMGATGSRSVPGGGATIIAHENVIRRMLRETPQPLPNLPNSEYFTDTKDLFFNGEPVFVIHVPSAHTDGDSIVLFRRSDVISAGDVFMPDRYPVIDINRGGSVQGLLAALNRLLVLAVPERLQDGGTRIIPGHGRICNEADVVEYRDMVTIVRDRIQDMVARGLSLDQAKAAGPTRDYDGQYGNAEAFVEAVYTSLRRGTSRL
jgi:glyoxylase-like metal-dependent hydrolase (beta-lactamase superfamily II)